MGMDIHAFHERKNSAGQWELVADNSLAFRHREFFQDLGDGRGFPGDVSTETFVSWVKWNRPWATWLSPDEVQKVAERHGMPTTWKELFRGPIEPGDRLVFWFDN